MLSVKKETKKIQYRNNKYFVERMRNEYRKSTLNIHLSYSHKTDWYMNNPLTYIFSWVQKKKKEKLIDAIYHSLGIPIIHRISIFIQSFRQRGYAITLSKQKQRSQQHLYLTKEKQHQIWINIRMERIQLGSKSGCT